MRYQIPVQSSLVILWLLLVVAPATGSAEEPLDPSLNEQVLSVPGDPSRPVTLQVTTFTPDGAGPFPLAILNHGKTSGKYPKDEPRYRSAYIARYFLSRGYAVALPMIRGFAGSGGTFNTWGCDVSACGLDQVGDLEAVIDYLVKQPNIDGSRIIVSGQSMGGWNTLAFATKGHAGVRGYLNFAGGIQEPQCPDWEENLIKGAGEYGARTRLPSLWFYGDNDSKFPPRVFRPMFDQYVKAGGPATLVAYGTFVTDAHNMLGSLEGFPIWMPKVDDFLTSLGLPGKLIEPRYLPVPFPPPSNFAALDDLQAVPYLNDQGRAQYKDFLNKPWPRVFFITPEGGSASFCEGFDPITHGMEELHKRSADGQIYAVDNRVVWTGIVDPVKAAEAYQQAAAHDDALAMFRLSKAYDNGSGVPADHEQALSWLQKAAEKGLSLAESRLGFKYENGQGVIKDYAQALNWFHQAADQGDAPAQNQIGNMYAHGWGVSPDDVQAFAWFQKAAGEGFAAAQYNVGYLYEKGLGVAPDNHQAAIWYQKAARQGFAQARQALTKLSLTAPTPDEENPPPAPPQG